MLCEEQEGAKRNVFPGGCEYGHTKSVTLVIIAVESQWRYLLKQTNKKKLSLICGHEIIALITTLQFYNEKRLIMSEKEHHRVHFGEDTDTFGKDNEIVIQKRDNRQLTAHLGFLQVGHRYEIHLALPRSLCELGEATDLRESVSQKAPSINCKLLGISPDKKDIVLKIELFAYKEKLLKEELCLERSDDKSLLTLVVMARVLGRGKGTPLLRNGIKCIGVELDDESEASDWQGFD